MLIAEGKAQQNELEALDATSFAVDSGIGFDSAVGIGLDGMEAGEQEDISIVERSTESYSQGARFVEAARQRVYTEALTAYSRQENAQEVWTVCWMMSCCTGQLLKLCTYGGSCKVCSSF